MSVIGLAKEADEVGAAFKSRIFNQVRDEFLENIALAFFREVFWHPNAPRGLWRDLFYELRVIQDEAFPQGPESI